jgi:lysozyme
MSAQALALLAPFEGVRPRAYREGEGALTIGLGHVLTPREMATGRLESLGIVWRRGLTHDACWQLLQTDLTRSETAVRTLISVPLSQGQFDALVLFTFNVGPGALEYSTLRARLNQGHYTNVPQELRRWSRVHGRSVPGLRARRAAEIRLWEGQS